MYIKNINEIDYQFKQVFGEVKMAAIDHNTLGFRLSKPLKEGVADKLELEIHMKQEAIKKIEPILDWGYYTNTNKRDNMISFRTPISSLSTMLETILTEKRIDESYLRSVENVKIEAINETNTVEKSEEDLNINQTYKLRENRITIYKDNFIKFFKEKYNVNVADVTMVYRDVNSGMVRRPSNFNDVPKYGDECEVTIQFALNESLRSDQIIHVNKEVRNIPFVDDVNTSRERGFMNFSFSTKVFGLIL